MKTLVLEYFDVYGKKHCIKLPISKKEEVLQSGLTIDASDVLGLLFVCDTEFCLKPVLHSLREHENKEVYFCRVYDDQHRLLDISKGYWIDKVKEEINRLGDFFFDKQTLLQKNVIVQPIKMI
ncbi:MAG: hypothetical protein N2449_07600 [Bacteroidales bacterium]|nr:hypothetical protein [Bacteroidales bacterium]